MTQLIENGTLQKPSDTELAALNVHLRTLDPQAIIAWANERFSDKLTLACSFGGVSGVVLLDMAMRVNRQLQVFYLDTAFLFPETLALRDELAARYGINPVAFKTSLTPQQQALQYGEALWEREPDRCCNLRKVEPNRQALAGKQAWIVGLRKDQSGTRREVQPLQWDTKFNLYKLSPLWDWTEDMVWTYIQAEGIPYNALHAQGYASIGCTNCTRPVAVGEDSRAGRWSGQAKTECGLHR